MKTTRSCDVYIDGASKGNPGPSGVGVVFLEPDGTTTVHKEISKHIGPATNNVAEYLALIYALQEALKQQMTNLRVRTDSELLARQVTGIYKVKNPQLRLFHDLALHLIEGFHSCRIEHIPREQNAQADKLASRAAMRENRAL